MATQIFELGTNLPKGAPKDVLTQKEALAFCAGFGQTHAELDAFMARHNFDQWRCVEVDIYDQYSAGNDPDGHLDCSPSSILGILITSMSDEAPERKLRKYSPQGIDIKFKYDNAYEVFLDHFPGCPLWVCQIKSWSKYSLNAVVLLPEEFWDENGPDYDSYGYPYTVEYPSSYNHWYWGGRDKDYHKLRMGAFSSNTLETDGRAIPYASHDPHYDPTQHRILLTPDYAQDEVTYYDLAPELVPQKIEVKACSGMAVKEDVYRFYTKKAVVITDKSFVEQGKMTSKTGLPKGNKGMQEFEADGWNVMVTQSGIGIQSPESEVVSKLSTYKLNTYSSKPGHSMMTVDHHNRLLIVGAQVALVKPDLSLSSISLKKAFKKEIQPILGEYFISKDSNSAQGVLRWSKEKQWFFLNAMVFSLNESDEPVLLNQHLKELCGEFVFNGGIYDSELKGAWLLARLGRLVFLPETQDKAYLFNVSDQKRDRPTSSSYLNFDRDHNLWFGTQESGMLHCIQRAQLKAKLKTAIPFGS